MTVMNKNRTIRPINAQDWEDIERKLKGFFHRVVLICDGYELTLQLMMLSPYKNAICLFVNGEVQGKWYFEDCEERRRFFCPRSKALHKKKDLEAMKRISKKMYREWQTQKYTYYESRWSSFQSLKRHLIKHNQVIEIVCEEEA